MKRRTHQPPALSEQEYFNRIEAALAAGAPPPAVAKKFAQICSANGDEVGAKVFQLQGRRMDKRNKR